MDILEYVEKQDEKTPTSEELKEIQEYALKLHRDGMSLGKVRKKVIAKYGVDRSVVQVGRWVQLAAKRAVQNENLMDIDVKTVKSISELDKLQARIERLLEEKVIKYDYEDEKGVRKQEVKPIAPMFLVNLMNTLAIVLEKKNQVRGLMNNQVQVQLQQQYNSYNNNLQVGDDFKHFDSSVQERLKNIFEESEQLSDVSSTAEEVGGSGTSV